MELAGCSLYDLSTRWPGDPTHCICDCVLPDRLLAGIAIEALTILQHIHSRGCAAPPHPLP